VLGPRSTYVTFVAVSIVAGLTFVTSTWVVFTVLTIAMLVLFGPRHPRVLDEHVPLDRARLVLALCALAIFIVCFTPAPITMHDLIKR